MTSPTPPTASGTARSRRSPGSRPGRRRWAPPPGPAPAGRRGWKRLRPAPSPRTPPPGSLLVALVSADGGSGVNTVTVTGGGYAWTEKSKANGATNDYAGVWIADVPAVVASAPALPGPPALRHPAVQAPSRGPLQAKADTTGPPLAAGMAPWSFINGQVTGAVTSRVYTVPANQSPTQPGDTL